MDSLLQYIAVKRGNIQEGAAKGTDYKNKLGSGCSWLAVGCQYWEMFLYGPFDFFNFIIFFIFCCSFNGSHFAAEQAADHHLR